jgi:uncharacterized protein YggU (UPF0235/DUF167 family)
MSGWRDGCGDSAAGELHAVRAHTGGVRIAVRVRPGFARPSVGGEHDRALVVRVSEPAVDGQATAAVLASVAAAFGVGRWGLNAIPGAPYRGLLVAWRGALAGNVAVPALGLDNWLGVETGRVTGTWAPGAHSPPSRSPVRPRRLLVQLRVQGMTS